MSNTLPELDDGRDHDAARFTADRYPRLRFMGSKFRLLPWIVGVLDRLDFETALDPFCGSGCVAYLLKAMGKSVTASDMLEIGPTLAAATVANQCETLSSPDIDLLRSEPRRSTRRRFIRETFDGIFYTSDDLDFLDRVWSNLDRLGSETKRKLALSALVRSCAKRQPRGVFTVADPSRYDDGRRDLRLSIEEHFVEQVDVYNEAVFDSGKGSRAMRRDVFDLDHDRHGDDVPRESFDLVYLDPPYVPRSDDNCYVKRYHFLEGLCCYWEGREIMLTSKVKKIVKPKTPFGSRRTALEAFERLFGQFGRATLVLSYSSNGYPDLDVLVGLMAASGRRVDVHEREHRYHFGTHGAARRNEVIEYLIVGKSIE